MSARSAAAMASMSGVVLMAPPHGSLSPVPGLRGFRASLAVLEMQFRSVGTVAGIAAFAPGFLRVSCAGGWRGDPTPVMANSATSFFNQLWQTAVDRLHQQAVERGADGVVGVRVDQRRTDLGWQLQLSGTGFRLDAAERLQTPFLSALPMSDFVTLLGAGWVPSGIAWGNAAVHVHGPAMSAYYSRVQGINAEMPGPTQAVNAARAGAEAAVQASLRGSGSRGVVGMSIDIQRSAQACWGSRGGSTGMLVHAHAVGTGVVRFRDAALHVTPTRQLSRSVAGD